MASLVGVTADLRAILATHVALKLMDRRRLRPANDIERNGLMGIATKATYFKIEIARVDRVAQRRRRRAGPL